MTLLFSLDPTTTIDEAWQELDAAGVEVLYSTEDPDSGNLIVGNLPDGLPAEAVLAQCKIITTIQPFTLPEIDWSSQWAAHGLNYHDGYVHLDLRQFGYPDEQISRGNPLRLESGPGFGDLSHPTTRLVLRLMHRSVQGQYVVDIGCGSGVLSLGAIAMGAASVDGIDIEAAALSHAKHNAELNEMNDYTTFMLPNMYKKPASARSAVILMNMIRSEQLVAWSSLLQLHHLPGESLVSGVLEEERHVYCEQCRLWGWTLIEEISEDGWLGFRFSRD